IKVATDPEEVFAAYKLVYQTYFDSNLSEFEKEGLRVTKFALLPTTSLIVVKHKGEVIATVSHIADSGIGLPLEKLWPLYEYRRSGGRIAEISTLCVKKGFRRQRGKIILPLMIYLFKYALEYLGTDYFVIATHPASRAFYSGLFDFKPLSKKAKQYKDVKGAWAYGQILHLTKEGYIDKIAAKRVGRGDKSFSVVDLFKLEDLGVFTFPERNLFKAFDPSFKLDMLEELMKKRIGSMQGLGEFDKEVLMHLFAAEEDHEYLRNHVNLLRPESIRRKEPRFKMFCAGSLVDCDNSKLYRVKVLEISKSGILIRANKDLHVGFQGILQIRVSPEQVYKLKIEVVNTRNSTYGSKVTLVDKPSDWEDMVDVLFGEINPKKIKKEEPAEKSAA
ncbi:MAG: PilZ domain-containing protein, partial [Bdellovibrionales bacterium]|nr:PilZ domain-containing protein [Bdellovibrionales bacterium]